MPFETVYSTKTFGFNKINNSVTIKIVQNGSAPYADIDQIKLNACGVDILPQYARYTGSNLSVLDDILEIDNNVVISHEKEIEVSWDIPESCTGETTLYLTANEYRGGKPMYYPDIGLMSVSNNSFVPLIDGSINETDGIVSPSYITFWRPSSGHPEGYTYIYTSQDDNKVYISLDVTSDNTNEYAQDWAEITFSTITGYKSFKIDDLHEEYGKCAFGLTSQVPYKHKSCEFAIPKNEIGDDNAGFRLRYYGTVSLSPNGIYLLQSDNNTLSNNAVAYTCGGHGTFLYSSSGNNLANNIANGNSQYGLNIYNSNNTVVTGDHYFNNNRDLYVASAFSNPFTLNLHNVIFDSALGNLTNYTTLSLNDEVDLDGAYSISWAQTPSSPPNLSFEFKTVNITRVLGAASLDSITWHWSDAELSGYNENGFRIWRHNSSNDWIDMGASLNAAANTLSLTNLVPESEYSILEGEAIATPITPTSSGGGTSKKTLWFNATAVCPGDIVDIYTYSSSGGISGVEVRAILSNPYQGLIALNDTDSSGHVQFNLPSSGTYDFYASASGYYQPDKIVIDFTPCSEEEVQNVTSNVTQNVTAPVTPQPECTVDSDCQQDEYCSSGTCTQVTGSCGYAANYSWTNYECCDDGDCQSLYACKDNACELKSFNISGSGGLVGSNSTVTLYSDAVPLANADLKITKPDGSYDILTTDSDGQIIFPLFLAGNYTIEFISSGTKLASLTLAANENAPAQEAPVSILGVIAQAVVGLLLLLLLLIGAFLIYKFFIAKGKGGKR